MPVLVALLTSSDTDVQYYCTTALSNIAVDSVNRKKLAQTEPKLGRQPHCPHGFAFTEGAMSSCFGVEKLS